jgi:hypothetical protein
VHGTDEGERTQEAGRRPEIELALEESHGLSR